jgi:hypothetical protein
VDTNGEYREEVLTTTNTKLAAVLLLFGARLKKQIPLDWTYVHESRENFLRHLENRNGSKPKARVTFNFENGTVPAAEIVKAYEKDIASLQHALEQAINSLTDREKAAVRDAVSGIIARSCREVLEKREFLVDLIKSMPENSKWDEVYVGDGSRTPFVKMGRNSSQELRAKYLSKL